MNPTSLAGLSLCALITCAAAGGHAQTVERIDVNPTVGGGAGLRPQKFLTVGGLTFFEGEDGPNGAEPWRTDGTAAGTFLLADIEPGSGGSSMGELTAAGSALYFLAGPNQYQRRLWRSDGTVAGTRPVRDAAGTVTVTGELAAIGGTVLYTTYAADQVVLMKTDGTPGGTIQVKAFGPETFVQRLTSAGSLVYFVVSDVTGMRLWRSDGSDAGTVALASLCATCLEDVGLTASGNRLYFVASTPESGTELWVTEGVVTNTVLVRDVTPGAGSTRFWEMVDAAGTLYFSTGDGTRQLWRSDGTEAGTTMAPTALTPLRLTALGNRVTFFPSGSGELWVSDGTSAGTVSLANVCGPSCSIGTPVDAAGFVWVFVGTTGSTAARLWRSDGTPAGTLAVAQFSGPAGVTHISPSPNDPLGQRAGNALYFSAYDGANGYELWRSAGTPATTAAVTNTVGGPSNPRNLVASGDRLFFNASCTLFDIECTWSTLGTAATTARVPGPRGWDFDAATPLRGGLLFTMDSNFPGIWWSDGTAAGTRVVKEHAKSGSMTTRGDAAFVSSSIGGLLTTDGTAAGTRSVFDLAHPAPEPGGRLAATDTLVYASSSGLWRTDGSAAGSFGVLGEGAFSMRGFGNRLYFFAQVPFTDLGLLSSDGTVAGTRLLANTELSPGTHAPRSLQPHGAAMYFVGANTATGSELWRTDGSVEGTRLVKDIRPGTASSKPTWLTSVGPWLFFLADDGVHGYELWRSDGTEEGTQLVRDLAPGADSPFPDAADGGGVSFGSTGTELLFAAYQQATGLELWVSDGTEAGTRLLRDLAPGPSSSSPAEFVRAGGRTYFRADDGTGPELWTVTGTTTASIDGASVVEGDAGTTAARFRVSLSAAASAPVTVSYTTGPGSAQPGADYVTTAGTVTFPAGAVGPIAIDVPVVADRADEDDEWFVVGLTSASVAIERAVGVGAIEDDDAPRVTVANATVTEGAGPVDVTVTLHTEDGGVTASSKTVSYLTAPQNADGSADYWGESGTMTFPAGTPDGAARTFDVTILDDRQPEPAERFDVRAWPLESPVSSTAVGTVTILDDDGGRGRAELSHGTVYRGELGPASHDVFVLVQQPLTSYEILADEISGDAGPLVLSRIAPNGSVVGESVPVGTGGARSLRWTNEWEFPRDDDHVAVEGGNCGTACGADDRYRLRMLDTTLRGGRLVTGAQQTAIILQNRTDRTVTGKVWLWAAEPLTYPPYRSFTLAPRGTWVLNLGDSVGYGFSGSATVTHDAGYEGLAGKTVTFDTAAGLSFDTPMTSRPR